MSSKMNYGPRKACPETEAGADLYEALDFSGALQEIQGWVGWLNQRIVIMAPWEMAKGPRCALT